MNENWKKIIKRYRWSPGQKAKKSIIEEDLIENERFKRELKNLINRYSQENKSNTPDFILARYIMNCLYAFSKATEQREEWYNRK